MTTCLVAYAGALEGPHHPSPTMAQKSTLSSNRSAQQGAQAIIWDILPCTHKEAQPRVTWLNSEHNSVFEVYSAYIWDPSPVVPSLSSL